MEFYITQCIAGFIAFDENFQIAKYKLFKEDEIVSNLIKIEENEILEEEIELINELELDSLGENKIIIETTKRRFQYKELKNFEDIEIKTPNKGGEYLRNNLYDVLEKIRFGYNKEYIIQTYERLAIEQIKKSSQEEDKLLIQTINSVDDVDESISKLVERIRDWYTIYFPEMDTITNNETYIKLIAESEDREDIIESFKDQFKDDVEYSSGADIEEYDLLMLKSFAESIYSLQNSRKELEIYIDSKMEEIAPNLRDLLGATLGAKLIAHIGSIKRLATYPASVIQIMGAEKAIFRHLKTGERPPKHGLIFQHPSVRGAKWWNRGKIARNLALKITFAVRKDVFSGEYDSSIAEDYLKKLEEIEKENPFPKKTSQKRAKERRNEKGKGKVKPKKYKGNKKNKKNRKRRK
ncbi:NOP5/NOP56 family protein [Methanobrevibacter olleyae]|uniref:Pre-mRNA splicing ribonucleoprotein PRP31 n=1 Tax=Methanobrevibacter olleyae TaxID=294671 RepID=A0A126R0T6_METOL|nr:ATP-binding protein [Methanobrevibacter olleyae]AMK15983.1 pre-mRNA splicing ribonucleoprotein PRP31 [Methanobrevibacter olleyae]